MRPLALVLLASACSSSSAVQPHARLAHLALRTSSSRSAPLVALASPPPSKPWLAMMAYSSIGVGFAGLVTKTCLKHPLFPFQAESAAWSFSWLVTTVFDYYGAALCLCGVILSTEPPAQGALWSLGVLGLGTPVCAAWMVSRLWRHGAAGLQFRTLCNHTDASTRDGWAVARARAREESCVPRSQYLGVPLGGREN